MPMAEISRNEADARRTERWQRRLLPLMIWSIIIMGLVFFVTSLVQLYYLHSKVDFYQTDLQSIFEDFEKKDGGAAYQRNLDYLYLKTGALLEQNVIARRYHQANSVMLARVWTRYLGFVTGMILALVGAVFILGKLREEPIKLDTASQGLKFSLATSSPGIVLAVLGTFLIAITLIVRFEISTIDQPLYVRSIMASQVQIPPPKAFPAGADSSQARKTEDSLIVNAPHPTKR